MPAHDPAIRVRNPGKKYTIGGPQEQYLTLRDAIVNSVKVLFHPRSLYTPAVESLFPDMFLPCPME